MTVDRSAPTRARRHPIRRGLALTSAAALALLAVPGVAHADNVTNNVGVSGSTSITVGGKTTIDYTIKNINNNGGDPQNQCNTADVTPATLKVNVPSDVTVTPSSRVYSRCDVAQSFEFSASNAGSYPITVTITDSGLGAYTTTDASFTLNVTQPAPVNTKPVVTIDGVVHGATYAYGAVPPATCLVSDKEDGDSSFPASVSAVTGARSAAGLGSETASCSYTDTNNGGGLNASASATYTIADETGPELDVVPPAVTEATGRMTAVTWTATANDAIDGNRPVGCQDADGDAVAPGDGFPVGTSTITCAAVDVTGNKTTADAFEIVVRDTTGPAVNVPGNMVQGNDEGHEVSYGPVTATDLVEGTLTASCTPASGSTFPLGTTAVTCQATDSRGNQGDGAFTVTVQDETAPEVTTPEPITEEATGPGGAPVTFAVHATDDVDPEVAVSCSRESGSMFALGATEVTCTAEDQAGNVGTNNFVVTVQDTTTPVLDLPADKTVEATSANGALVEFSATASDVVDGTVSVTCDPESGTELPLGATTITCEAEDTRGNAATRSFTVTVVDTTAPTLSAVKDVLGVEATSPYGAAVAYERPTATDAVDPTPVVVCDPSSGSVFALGRTTVTCTATDGSGNAGQVSFQVGVVDTVAPAVTPPANVVVGNDAGAEGAGSVPYGAATASDVVDGDVEVTCTPASGSAFPMGESEVVCTAEDQAGNIGTGSFTVTVEDRNAPKVSVPADVQQEATGPHGATVTFLASALDDVSGDVDTTCVPPSGATFALGTTTVVCTAEDAAGNVGLNDFDVTVSDTLAPVIPSLSNMATTATSAAGATVSWSAITASDVVDGNVPVTCERAPGSVFGLGTTTVACSSTDAAGNKATKTFTVTITVPWSGILQPIDANGSSVFKQGSTVPVKFRPTGTAASVTTLQARLSYTKVGSAAGTVSEAVSTASSTTGNLFRWSPEESQYIFNLGTKGMSVGTYLLLIDLGDGEQRTVKIALR